MLCLALSAFACSLSGQAFETSFETGLDRVFVNVAVNGEGPFRFMVDLGASGIGRIDERLVRQLNLPAAGTAQNSDGVNVSTVAVVEVADLTFGPITVRNVELSSRDYNRSPRRDTIMGILGQAFFDQHLLMIDYPSGMLHISDDHLTPNEPHVVAYESNFRVPVTIGHVQTTGAIDTGSNLVMHLPRRYATMVSTSPLEPDGIGRRANTTFTLYRGTVLEPITIAGSAHDSVTVSFSELVEEINIGSGFLNRFVLRVDQDHRLVQLVPH